MLYIGSDVHRAHRKQVLVYYIYIFFLIAVQIIAYSITEV